MKIDVTKPIYDLDGNEIKLPAQKQGEKEGATFTLGAAVKAALLASLEGDNKGDEEFERFRLALRIADAKGEVDITIDEAKTIKDRVAQCYSTLVMGRVWQALEDASSPRPRAMTMAG